MRDSTLHIKNKLGVKTRFKNHAIAMIIGVVLLAGIGVGTYFIVNANPSAKSGK